MKKHILWVDDNSIQIMIECIENIDENLEIIHASNLIKADYLLKICDIKPKYDYIIFDVQMPLLEPNSHKVERKRKSYDYFESDTWGGYQYVVDNIDFLVNEYYGRFAFNTGYPNKMIKNQLVEDGINPEIITIFNKGMFEFDDILKWVNEEINPVLKIDYKLPEKKVSNNYYQETSYLKQQSDRQESRDSRKYAESNSDDREKAQLSDYDIIWIDDEYIPPRIIEKLTDNGISVKYYRNILQFIHDYNQNIFSNKNNNCFDTTVILIAR